MTFIQRKFDVVYILSKRTSDIVENLQAFLI